MQRVFISYSRRNKTFAERIARDLSDAGLDVWIDFRQILGGEFWRDEIQKGLDNSDFLVVCVSPDAIASEWVTKEVLTAREQNKPIIPINVIDAFPAIEASAELSWLMDIQYVDFAKLGYERAFPALLQGLPGAKIVGAFDQVDPQKITNPFKGLEAFQQTDANFFFGRETLIHKTLRRLERTRFLAVVGASGSGKSSLVRAGVLPQLRTGAIKNSENWRMMIFAPGVKPLESMAARLHPLLADDDTQLSVSELVSHLQQFDTIKDLFDRALGSMPDNVKLFIVIDQFEEAFTLASQIHREPFIQLLNKIASTPDIPAQILLTMRADFFGELSRYPALAELFEQENLVIVTQMTTPNLIRAIEGPANAVGLQLEDGLVGRIVEDVKSQPGSLPLLQYALRELFKRRDGITLTIKAYDEIGGVQKALAQHAENIFNNFSEQWQELMRQILLRLVEITDSGEATRRKVERDEIIFHKIPDADVDNVIDRLTAADSRLLVISREIRSNENDDTEPKIWVEVGHEALIREWDRFKTWVTSNADDLRYESELRKESQDWVAGAHDSAYLLRGKRLRRAEIWLERSTATQQQREYIEASLVAYEKQQRIERERQERELQLKTQATSRLRWLAAVLILGLVASAILSLIAIDRNNEAELRNQDLQEQSIQLAQTAEEALSLAMAAIAGRLEADNDNDLAVALALFANETEDNDSPPIQAQRTLYEVALSPGTRYKIDIPEDEITAVTFQANGGRIATGMESGDVIVWDASSGTEMRRSPAHSSPITDVALSPDGRYMVSAAEDDNDLIVWGMLTGIASSKLKGHETGVSRVTIASDSRFVVSGDRSGTVIIWDVALRTEVGRFHQFCESCNITALATYSDNSPVTTDIQDDAINLLIASATGDGSIVIWDLETQAIKWELSIESSPLSSVTSLSFNADGTLLLVTGDDVNASTSPGKFVLFNVGDGSIAQDFVRLDDEINTAAFLQGALNFVLGVNDGTLQVWDNLQQIAVFEHDDAIIDLAAIVDDLQIISAQNDTLRLWDIQGSEIIQEISLDIEPINRNARTVAISPDNQHLLAGASGGSLSLWNHVSGELITTLGTNSSSISIAAVAFHPDGTKALVGASDGSITLWSINPLDTATPVQQFIGHERGILSLAFSPDGGQIVSGASDNRVLIWDVETAGIIRHLEGIDGNISAVTYSADGTLISAGSSSGNSVTVWNTTTGEVIQKYIDIGTITTIAISTDNKWLASGSRDGEIRLWDLTTGELFRRINEHNRSVNSVVFTPDSQRLLSGSSDGTIRLWDIITGTEMHRYEIEDERGRSIDTRAMVLSTDGQQLVATMNDRTLRTWRVLPTLGDLIDWTRANRFIPPIDCDADLSLEIRATVCLD